MALRICTPRDTNLISNSQLHLLYQRAPPEQYLLYKHALQLYRVLNNMKPVYDWTVLNFTQSLTSRQTKLMAIKTNNFKVGFDLLCNRLSIKNGKFELTKLNKQFVSYKVGCKNLFLC